MGIVILFVLTSYRRCASRPACRLSCRCAYRCFVSSPVNCLLAMFALSYSLGTALLSFLVLFSSIPFASSCLPLAVPSFILLYRSAVSCRLFVPLCLSCHRRHRRHRRSAFVPRLLAYRCLFSPIRSAAPLRSSFRPFIPLTHTAMRTHRLTD